MSLLGKPAPDFTLVNTNKEQITLSAYRGKKVVLAFYPAAFTGVCEKELCTFRDQLEAFNGLNAEVMGISVDPPFANKAWAAKNNLTYNLLSDLSKSTIAAYDVVFNDLAGIPGYVVAKRSVFVVNETGDVIYEWVGPNPGVEPDYAAVKAVVGG